MLTSAAIASTVAPYFRDKPVRKAYLFGSVARNEASSTSDVDILIELDSSQLIGLIEYIKMMEGLEALLGRKVDLVSTDALSPYLKTRIDQEKVLIYEA
ncbi:nucleotidyltransferase family protein [Larkinella sp. VNQ87]|uniref:nucleotidyltransferase family protein n=1 Tax=Larkinella sp. VNQ87 TaxID=3400921 RepID=UPI003C0BECA0